MKIMEVSFDEFLEVQGLDTDDLKDNEVEEKEIENENDTEETLANEIEKLINHIGMLTVTTAMKSCFEGRKAEYHQAISKEIGHTLTDEEMKLADIAFQYAFIDGWSCHEAIGESNDK